MKWPCNRASRFAWILTVVLLTGGCARTITTPSVLPGEHQMGREQLVVHSDFQLAPNHRLLEELIARRGDLQQRLDLPISDERIHVYLFEDADRFDQHIQTFHPDFPARRAFFMETDTRLAVYAQWGDRVAEDLRHEVTHAYLHSTVPQLPLWLDEGLAEYFEVARGQRGLNRQHVRLLQERIDRGQWRPDLARLEALDPQGDMTLDDYSESWAWVHFLLETRPEHRAIVQGYLLDLRREGFGEPLGSRVERYFEKPDRALLEHVRFLAAGIGREGDAL